MSKKKNNLALIFFFKLKKKTIFYIYQGSFLKMKFSPKVEIYKLPQNYKRKNNIEYVIIFHCCLFFCYLKRKFACVN